MTDEQRVELVASMDAMAEQFTYVMSQVYEALGLDENGQPTPQQLQEDTNNA